MSGRDARYRLAVDVGGTFTDVVLEPAASEAERVTVKVLTTYDDPANGVMQGIEAVLERAGANAADGGLVLHGTTLATNALIERRGARTALLTTHGHRDAGRCGPLPMGFFCLHARLHRVHADLWWPYLP